MHFQKNELVTCMYVPNARDLIHHKKKKWHWVYKSTRVLTRYHFNLLYRGNCANFCLAIRHFNSLFSLSLLLALAIKYL